MITLTEFKLLEDAVEEYKRGRDTHESTNPQRIANGKKMDTALNKLSRELLKKVSR